MNSRTALNKKNAPRSQLSDLKAIRLSIDRSTLHSVVSGLFFILYLLSDFFWRSHELLAFRGEDIAFLTSSIVFRALFTIVISMSIVHIQKSSVFGAWTFAFQIAFTLAIIVVSSYIFHQVFQAMPSTYALHYVFEEPLDAFHMFRSSLNLKSLMLISLLTLSLTFFFMDLAHTPLISGLTKKHFIYIVLTLLSLTPFFHNNVRNFPGVSVAEVNAIFGTSYAGSSYLRGEFVVRGLGNGMHEPVRAEFGKLPFNVLLIINESLRAQSSPMYSREGQKGSQIMKELEASADDLFVFNRAYSNSTSTVTSFPGILSGINPSLPPNQLHKAPLLFDFAKAFQNTETFLISSQSYKWGRFSDYLKSSDIDYLWYLENSGIERPPGLFLEDSQTIDETIRRLNQPRDSNFVGAIQFFGTHSPYDIDPDDKLSEHSDILDLNHYQSSIKRLDRSTAKLFQEMKRLGLWDNTLILSTSDHGEGFGEHGYSSHTRTFYDEEAKIPLWIKVPKNLSKSLRTQLSNNSNMPVSNDDVLPTLVHLMMSERQETALDEKQTGRWMGHALGGYVDNERVIVMKSNRLQSAGEDFMSFGMVSKRFKLLHWIKGKERFWECFDMLNDPYELKSNCSAIHDNELNAFRSRLGQIIDAPPLTFSR